MAHHRWQRHSCCNKIFLLVLVYSTTCILLHTVWFIRSSLKIKITGQNTHMKNSQNCQNTSIRVFISISGLNIFLSQAQQHLGDKKMFPCYKSCERVFMSHTLTYLYNFYLAYLCSQGGKKDQSHIQTDMFEGRFDIFDIFQVFEANVGQHCCYKSIGARYTY